MESITSPANCAVVDEDTVIILRAKTQGNEGSVTKLEFCAEPVKIDEDAAAPYEYGWTNPAVGTHSLTAVAVDDAQGKVEQFTEIVKKLT